MNYKGYFISWYWSHTLSIISEGFTALKTSGLLKKIKKIKCIPITTITLPKINLEHLELLRPWGPQSQLPVGFTAHEKGFNFHAQPQTGPYSCCYYYVSDVINI